MSKSFFFFGVINKWLFKGFHILNSFYYFYCIPNHFFLFSLSNFRPNININISPLHKSTLIQILAILVQKIIQNINLKFLHNPLSKMITSTIMKPGWIDIKPFSLNLRQSIIMKQLPSRNSRHTLYQSINIFYKILP
jgi:hypothetical protein